MMSRRGLEALVAMAKGRLPPGAKSLTTKVPPGVLDDAPGDAAGTPVKPVKGVTQARYTKPGADGLNDTERDYGRHLEARKQAGEIADYRPHAFKLLVVPGVPKTETTEGIKAAWYTPDFVVFEADQTISFHELKGYLDRSGEGFLKFKAAASIWPFPFYLVRKVSKAKGTWDVTRFAR